MKKFTFSLKLLSVTGLWLFLSSFSVFNYFEDYIVLIQKTLTEHYDMSQEIASVKKFELNVTNNGFCRYKRYFNNGKIEYFAFKLAKFKDLDYAGTTSSGRLYLRTKGEDVIVQTYNDRSGDIDSMATYVVVPLKNVEAEDLNMIRDNLLRLGQ